MVAVAKVRVVAESVVNYKLAGYETCAKIQCVGKRLKSAAKYKFTGKQLILDTRLKSSIVVDILFSFGEEQKLFVRPVTDAGFHSCWQTFVFKVG